MKKGRREEGKKVEKDNTNGREDLFVRRRGRSGNVNLYNDIYDLIPAALQESYTSVENVSLSTSAF